VNSQARGLVTLLCRVSPYMCFYLCFRCPRTTLLTRSSISVRLTHEGCHMAEFAIQTMILALRDGNKKFQRCDYTEISSIVVHFFIKKISLASSNVYFSHQYMFQASCKNHPSNSEAIGNLDIKKYWAKPFFIQ
jgi:hypothetical protein